jgi:hypothetical protein
MYERDLGFETFGQKFTLGTERLVFDTVVPTIDETPARWFLTVWCSSQAAASDS